MEQTSNLRIKSKISCAICQRRKVKCDREGPCGACIRRKEPCSLDPNNFQNFDLFDSNLSALPTNSFRQTSLAQTAPLSAYTFPQINQSPACRSSDSIQSYNLRPNVLPNRAPIFYNTYPESYTPLPLGGLATNRIRLPIPASLSHPVPQVYPGLNSDTPFRVASDIATTPNHQARPDAQTPYNEMVELAPLQRNREYLHVIQDQNHNPSSRPNLTATNETSAESTDQTTSSTAVRAGESSAKQWESELTASYIKDTERLS